MIKKIYRRFKDDKMYLLCWIITFISLAAGVLFPNALLRLAESIKDLFMSLLYYCFEIVSDGENPISPTVVSQQNWNIFSEVWEPLKLFPSSIAEFFDFWGNYFKLVFSSSYFLAYLNIFSNFFRFLAKFLLVAIWPCILIYLKLLDTKNTKCLDANKKSKELKFYLKYVYTFKEKVLIFFYSFVTYLVEHSYFYVIWLIVWLFYFNVFSIAISLVAFYLYFISSWNLFSLYGQLLKLQMDLTSLIRLVPLFVWLIIGFKFYDNWCKSIGDDKIFYAHRCNKAFLRKRGISTVLYGKMGTYKSQTEVAMSVTLQDIIFEDNYETMYKYHKYFPNFPWQNFRNEINYLIDKRIIVDTISCRKTMQKYRQRFDKYVHKFTAEEYQKWLSKKWNLYTDYSFNYDYDKYSIVYNNGIRIIPLYETLEEYACAYLVFTVNSSLLFSNISIASDSELRSEGNMPYRVSHLLDKDPYERMRHRQYAHIIDMDMIRRAKQLVKDNPKARTILPGIYIMDEIHNERKNTLELKDTKSTSDEVNQKNDGHNIGVSTCRHSNLIDYRSNVYFLSTIHRPDSLGAGTRQIGELAVVMDKSELLPVLPFFSPFWLFETFYLFLNSIYDPYIKQVRTNRSDQTLTLYLMENIMAKLSNHYEKIYNLYGVRKLTINIDDGLIEGKVETDYWRQIVRNEWSGLYVSDCLRSIYEPNVPNEMHIDDYPCYSSIVATQEEGEMQHSYFQNEIRKMKGACNED